VALQGEKEKELRVFQPAEKGHNNNQEVEVKSETNINRNL